MTSSFPRNETCFVTMKLFIVVNLFVKILVRIKTSEKEINQEKVRWAFLQ